jgi:ATP-dependent Lhr-like helicase
MASPDGGSENPIDRLHPALQHHIVNTLGWRNLRPLQRQAIQPLISGANAILVAPTAGGKTEAALFPILSRLLEEDWRGLTVLYVCPLKALLNNLAQRLEFLAELLGRRVRVWHGDVTEPFRREIRRSPPDLLLTTPESLESLLISAKSVPTSFFAGVRVAIVDEVHNFAASDRGWHLLAVLSRIEALTKAPIQRIGLSATVGNPQELLAWISPAGRPGQVIAPPAESAHAGTEVTIDFVGNLDNAAEVIASLYRGQKRLVFSDSRVRVEELAQALRERGVETYVSHSSLGVKERREAERAFAEGSNCVIVSTSTLELGIDVGDLDRVIQIDAPSSVASFLQRLGRTGRRPGTQRSCLFLATSPDGLLRAAALVELWKQGYVEPVVPPAFPVHLLAQQLMALVLQQRGLGVGEWERALGVFMAQAGLQQHHGHELLAYLINRGILVAQDGLVFFGPLGEQTYGYRHFMDLLVSFVGESLLTVLYGRFEVGQVVPLALSADIRQNGLLLAGRAWQILEIDWDRRRVQVEPLKGRGKVRWQGEAMPLGHRLSRECRRILTTELMAAEWTRRARESLQDLRDEFYFLDGDRTVIVGQKNGRQTWYTFAGLLANLRLAAALEAGFGLEVKVMDNYLLRWDRPLDADQLPAPGAPWSQLQLAPFRSNPSMLEHTKFNAEVPPGFIQQMLEHRYGAESTALQVLTEPISRFVPPSDTEYDTEYGQNPPVIGR